MGGAAGRDCMRSGRGSCKNSATRWPPRFGATADGRHSSRSAPQSSGCGKACWSRAAVTPALRCDEVRRCPDDYVLANPSCRARSRT